MQLYLYFCNYSPLQRLNGTIMSDVEMDTVVGGIKVVDKRKRRTHKKTPKNK